MSRWGALLALAAISALLGASAGAAPAADRHAIKWFVHTDLVSGAATLPFYEAMIEDALDDALIHLEGNQGPADTVCCQKLDQEEHSPGVVLQTFGTPGDGLDVVDGSDFDTLHTLGGSGSRAFLVDSILNCGGTSAIGCADLPVCDGVFDDDPDRILVVTLDAQDMGVLGVVIAHERGHNACLAHSSGSACELMQSVVSGGCLSPAECSAYGTARQSVGGTCACHAGTSQGTPEPDATACSDGPVTGLCSGGVCGDPGGDAGVAVVAWGGIGAAAGEVADDPLHLSALPGGWSDAGGPGPTLKGLAYDADGDVLYGIQDASGDDHLVTLDRSDWSVLSSVALAGHPDVISLAFDPGANPGPGDDRLLALSSSGGFEDLIQIAPATGSVVLLGGLSIGATGGFTGLAYDSLRGRLYTSGFASAEPGSPDPTAAGLFEIDVASCNPPFAFCQTNAVSGLRVPRRDSSLSYSPVSGALYLVGRSEFTLSGGGTHQVTRYDTIDAASLVKGTTIGIDDYTPAGLAALPAPEPDSPTGLLAGAALAAALARRRRRAGD
jgi:MYXO-CTERM domain-containing protein